MNASEQSNRHPMLIGVLVFATICMVGDVYINPGAAQIFEELGPEGQASADLILTIPGLLATIASLAMAGLTRIIDKKVLLLIGVACFTAGSVGLVIGSIPVILALRALIGVGLGFTYVAAVAIVADTYPEVRRRSRNIGVITTAMSIAAIVLLLLAGLLAAEFGWRAIFAINLLGIPLLVLIVMFVPAMPPVGRRSANDSTAFAPARRGWVSKLVLLLGTYLIFQMLYGSVNFQLAVYIGESGIGDASTAGVAASASAFGTLIGCICAPVLYRYLRAAVPLVALLLIAGGMTLMWVVPTLGPVIAACLLVGAAYGVFLTYAPTHGSVLAPAHRVDTAVSLVVSVMGIGLFLSLPVYTAMFRATWAMETIRESLGWLTAIAIVVAVLYAVFATLARMGDRRMSSDAKRNNVPTSS